MIYAIVLGIGIWIGYNMKRDRKIVITEREFEEVGQAIRFKDSISYEKRLN